MRWRSRFKKTDASNIRPQCLSLSFCFHSVPQIVAEGEQIAFTYDVIFKPSDIKWASRWDTYLQMTDDQIHWFSIINSLMIVLFLTGACPCRPSVNIRSTPSVLETICARLPSNVRCPLTGRAPAAHLSPQSSLTSPFPFARSQGMVAMIMIRTLRRDISQYNQLETAEEAQEETVSSSAASHRWQPLLPSLERRLLCGTAVTAPDRRRSSAALLGGASALLLARHRPRRPDCCVPSPPPVPPPSPSLRAGSSCTGTSSARRTLRGCLRCTWGRACSSSA